MSESAVMAENTRAAAGGVGRFRQFHGSPRLVWQDFVAERSIKT